MFNEEKITLTETDKKVIQDIVKHYPQGDRVKVTRQIFKQSCSTDHFLYLGIIIGQSFRTNQQSIHKMKVLSYLN